MAKQYYKTQGRLDRQTGPISIFTPMNESRNVLFDLAASYVHHTNRHLFLTGRAGTGKTTFLKQIQAQTLKNTVVVAPTGVAAINAGGVTMHSFFQLPFGPFIPGSRRGFDGAADAATDQHSLFKNIRFNGNKRKLLQELELLIIDEVSMVRADMLDAVDLILRHFRKKYTQPFGGVQVVYIGDLFQLPPVVGNEEWGILSRYYKSPFFFDAHVLQQATPLFIELKKIYRQNDADFIDLLNNVRNNCATRQDLDTLNSYYRPDFIPDEKDRYILLSTHNYRADEVNQRELERLRGKSHTFTGAIKGEFSDKALPVDMDLQLKEGAQIMFIKNDKGEARRYYNGKLATIDSITDSGIYVRFAPGDDPFLLEKEIWKNVRYEYNEKDDKVEEEEVGSYTQYPVRLAWAITIHKSQGLTFEKAIVDAGSAFAPGQVYVALSRLTSLKGLVLHSRINADAIYTDERILAFYDTEMAEDTIQQQLRQDQTIFMIDRLALLFDWNNLLDEVKEHHKAYKDRTLADKQLAMQWSAGFMERVSDAAATADKFVKQIHFLAATAEGDYTQLQQRADAAIAYFTKLTDEEILYSLQKHYDEIKVRKNARAYLRALEALRHNLLRKKRQLKQGGIIAKGLKDKTDAETIMKQVESVPPVVEAWTGDEDQKPKEDSKTISYNMFKEGKLINEIAAERGLSNSTVEGHLLQFIKTGEISVSMFVSDTVRDQILKVMEESESSAASVIKSKLDENITYTEIRAVFYYDEFVKGQV